MKAKRIIIKSIKAAILPVLFLAVWEIMGRKGIINTSILAMPSKILAKWIEMLENGKYPDYLLVSAGRFIKGFALGTICGLFIGTLMGLSRHANDFLGASTSLLRSIPVVAWVPIAILSLGVGESTKVILVAIGCFWAVFLNTMDGVKSVDFRYLEVAKVLEKNKHEVISRVVFPAAFPAIVTGLRSGFSNSWRGIVAAEMIGASSGIGYMISYGREVARPDMMYVGLVTVAVIGFLLDAILIHLQNMMLSRYNKKS